MEVSISIIHKDDPSLVDAACGLDFVCKVCRWMIDETVLTKRRKWLIFELSWGTCIG